MQYRKYGNTGKEVSLLGFGCMRFPKRADGKLDQEKITKLLNRAMELGVNHFDTAYVYEESERMMAEALSGGNRKKVYISTKNPVKEGDTKKWMEHLEKSLTNLNTDYVDFYLFHGLSWEEFLKVSVTNGPLDKAKELKKQGVIHHICFSCHDKQENMIKLIDTGHFEAITLQYNYLDRKNEPVIDHAQKKGLGVTVMGPAMGGKLVNRSDLVRDIKATNPWSEAEVAFRFVFSNPNVSNVLSGMNELSQLEENAAVASKETALNESDKQRVTAMADKYRKLADLYCTNCQYCLPCPAGIHIQMIFDLYTLHHVYKLEGHSKNIFSNIGKKGSEWAGRPISECLDCGVCETKCPQHIKIREQLKMAWGVLEKL